MHFLYALLTFWTALQTGLANTNLLFGDSPRRDLPFPDLVEYDGFKSETHTVTTEDGYILTLFRVLANESCSSDDVEPVMFMHGLYLSGDDCIIPGPKHAHCYIYSNNCFDVWVPNSRGNRYSRNHTTLNPDKDPEFWDFAFEDMGLKDLPAVIDYVLNATQKQQLSYVAHSQGVASLIVLGSKKPEYNDKIKVAFALSPTAWLDHATFFVISIEAVLAYFTAGAYNGTNGEILAHGKLVQTAGTFLCGLSELEYPACSVLVFAALGYNRFHITKEVLPVITGHTPAGTSIKDFIRWGQIKDNGFTEYDYGKTENLQKYGQDKPPEFDLSPVTMKWILIASDSDNVGTVADSKKLNSKLKNSQMCILRGKDFVHLDFLYADSLSTYVTPTIVTYLKTVNLTCDGEIVN